MITYNHEIYIEQAIESILLQKTSFPIKLFIGEDCSTDKTAAICLKYQQDNPDVIEVLLNNPNIGAINNALNIYDKCFSSGAKYIAMLEGDDYWTDPFKLQKQVNYLESNDDFTICHHNMKIIDRNGHTIRLSNGPNQKEETCIEDLAKGNYIYTASCVFRNGIFKKFPEWFKYCPVGDYVIHLLNAQNGKIKYINEIMGVYRIHDGGMWEHNSVIYRQIKWLTLLSLLDDKFSEKVNQILINQKEHIKKSIIETYELINLENQKTKQELNRIKGSRSYKIGCFIVKPFVGLKRWF